MTPGKLEQQGKPTDLVVISPLSDFACQDCVDRVEARTQVREDVRRVLEQWRQSPS